MLNHPVKEQRMISALLLAAKRQPAALERFIPPFQVVELFSFIHGKS